MVRPISERKGRNVFSPRFVGSPDWSWQDRMRLLFYRWLYRTGRINEGDRR